MWNAYILSFFCMLYIMIFKYELILYIHNKLLICCVFFRNIFICFVDKYVHDISLFGIYFSTFWFIMEITGRIYKMCALVASRWSKFAPHPSGWPFLSCVCLKINLKHIFVSVFNVQTHKHVVQTQPRKQLLSKQMKFYNLHFTVCEISKFLTLFANTIKSYILFCLFLSFYFLVLRTMI